MKSKLFGSNSKTKNATDYFSAALKTAVSLVLFVALSATARLSVIKMR